MIYNQEVQRWIVFFTKKPTPHLNTWLTRSYRYLPYMKKVLRSKNLPVELAYMTLIESNLHPHAVSKAKAVGYWQFIPSTARRFHLKITPWLDERKNFQKSTEAASRYLETLYLEFQSWTLALAAYNMGEKRLRSLIKKYESKDFWLLSKKIDFPKESSQYVPKVLAAIHIMKSPARYGFNQFQILLPYKYDIFYIPGGTHLKNLSKHTSISIHKLSQLNPELNKASIPFNIQNYPLRIPKGTGALISLWLKKKKSFF